MLVTIGAIVLGTAIWLAILRRYDRIEPEAIWNMVLVAVLGGGCSVAVAAVVNEGTARLLDIHMEGAFGAAISSGFLKLLVFSLVVGLTEETVKAVSTVSFSRYFGNLNEPVDGMIYAMSVGLGFASIENLLYATRFGNDVLLVRFLWPVPAHMAYAGIWGYGLSIAKFIYPQHSKIAVMAPYVLIAAVVHAGANFLLFMQETLTAFMSLVALAGLVYLAHLRLKSLMAESPFLEPGECPNCRNLNKPSATVCLYCGEPLLNTIIFVNCPCGRARVPLAAEQCPICDRNLRDRQSLADAGEKERSH